MSAPELQGDVIASFRNLNLNAMKAEIEKNKGGIEISELKFVDQNGFAEMAVVNKGSVSRRLVEIAVMSSCEGVFVLVENYSGVLRPFEPKIISVQCQPPCPGIYRGIICFQFEGFGIGRYAKFNYGDEVLAKALAPTSAFVRTKHQRRTPRNKIISGDGAEIGTGMVPYPRKLSAHPKSKESISAFETNIQSYTTFLKSLQQDFLEYSATHNGEVSMKLYCKLYQGLLNIEELQLGDDIHIFDMRNVHLKRAGHLLALTVDGLAEKRPSVLVGDIIHAHRSDDVSDVKYAGKVERIEQNVVFLKFHSRFHSQHTNSANYDVEFTINRRTWRSLLQGVNLSGESLRASYLASFLFPVPHSGNVDGSVVPRGGANNSILSERQDEDYISAAASAVPSLFFGTSTVASTTPSSASQSSGNNVVDALATGFAALGLRDNELNGAQQSAVSNILDGRGNTAPYIIFGPPGTGKTVTIVKTIGHFFSLTTNHTKRILVCAPSNTAADLLVERLSACFDKKEMFRLMSFMRNRNDVTERVKKYCDRDFQVPAIDTLTGFKIIVSTCMMASKLYNHGLPEGHFDVVFVDESGHTWEPEIMSTFVSSLKRHTGQLVLAGDPKQLGPITHNKAAAECGLALSLLERLIDRPLYSRDITLYPLTNGYNPRYITKLVNCYRCHPEIIRLPNALFYNNDLIPVADPSISHNLCNWANLKRQNFPLIFHGVEGECQQESTSPSWFNINEVEIVLTYVKQLLATTGSTNRVRASEIGIITPYARQVKKIKHALQINDIEDCMVGSCEQLQGQERRVIIISTVRSSSDYSSYDIKYNLGFVASPKRFNVAVTRAQALLIVVGSPKMLRGDEHWNALLQHCVVNGAYVGVPLGPAGGGGAGGGGANGDNSAAITANESHLLSILNNMRRDPSTATAAATSEQQEERGEVEDYEIVDHEE